MTRFLFLCVAIWFVVSAVDAHACMQPTGHKQIFFSTRPTNVPPELTVLKVIAPPGAEGQSTMAVDVLEDGRGAPTSAKLQLAIASSNPMRSCDMRVIGVVGRPAYVVGIYAEGRAGQTYFYALWLDAVYPKWREPKDWRSYIVDANVKAAAEKYGKQ